MFICLKLFFRNCLPRHGCDLGSRSCLAVACSAAATFFYLPEIKTGGLLEIETSMSIIETALLEIRDLSYKVENYQLNQEH